MAVNLALTDAGKILKAKIEAGGGTVALNLTRIMTGAGISADPLQLNAVVDEQQEFTILSRRTVGARTIIKAIITNTNIAPGMGYPLTQIGFYALDPDIGEILYRISQFDTPNYVPDNTERAWTFEPTFNIVTGNASQVSITINAPGYLSRQDIWDSVEYSRSFTPLDGVKTHYFIVKSMPAYVPAQPLQYGLILNVDGIGIRDAFILTDTGIIKSAAAQF